MKAPFPWFGGKRRVAPEVWSALGDVDNYVEPFAGSLAVLLERPRWHSGSTETVNDADHYLANLWRAIIAAPEEVARWADWPVNEDDLTARHIWLVTEGRARLSRVAGDPDFHDPKIAGWWLWGQCSWIGSGWCSGRGPWSVGADGLLEAHGSGQGVRRQRPHLGSSGQGAVNGSDMESGGSGAPRATWDRSLWREGEEPLVYGYMRALAARMRKVRVCCGDWRRIVTDGALSYGSSVGVLLDPPYSYDVRTADLYSTDCGAVSTECAAWARQHGEDRRLRIVLCCYEGEHDMPASWRTHGWSSNGAYLGGGGGGVNRENRHREMLWLSPGCLGVGQQQPLFG